MEYRSVNQMMGQHYLQSKVHIQLDQVKLGMYQVHMLCMMFVQFGIVHYQVHMIDMWFVQSRSGMIQPHRRDKQLVQLQQ
jgi:hypothetical protein